MMHSGERFPGVRGEELPKWNTIYEQISNKYWLEEAK